MQILSTSGWADYQLLDSGNSQKLERFGPYTLIRPDPQAIWRINKPQLWRQADAVFTRTEKDKGFWKFNKKIPDKWRILWNNLAFWVKLTPFKHTGVFPEQSIQWEWLINVIARSPQATKQSRESTQNPSSQNSDKNSLSNSNTPNILNLFGYTGVASLACAASGAKVTHLDASRPSLTWARENQIASNLQDKPIRWILDDAGKFVSREIKRGVRYDGIIMDPPVYGHGPKGERWDFYKDFPLLLENCIKLLSDQPLFILINAYAISASALMLENILSDQSKHLGGHIDSGELALQEKNSPRLLSTGIYARWSN